MSTPAAQIVATGTPVTNRLGVGAVAGNTVTFGGYTLAPNQPGWRLSSSTGGPGFVSGTWQFGVQSDAGGTRPAQGAFYRSASGGEGGGGGGGYYDEYTEAPQASLGLSKMGWILLGLIATLLLTDRKGG